MNLVPSQYPDYLGNHHPERPLPAKSIIDCNGVEFEVVHDTGGDTIEVWHDKEIAEINWDLADVMCTVVAVYKE